MLEDKINHSNSANGLNMSPKCPGLELVCLSLFCSRQIKWKVGFLRMFMFDVLL